MEGLNTSNFFSNYILNPFSSDLNKTDRLKALVGSIFLGVFALGIPHVVAFRHKVTPQQEPHNKETAIFNEVYPHQEPKYTLPTYFYNIIPHIHSDKLPELYRSALDGNVNVLKYFLDANPDVDINALEKYTEMTLLHLAIMNGSLECVNTLLERDDILPSLDQKDHVGRTPYDLAVEKSTTAAAQSFTNVEKRFTAIANAIQNRKNGTKPTQAEPQRAEVLQTPVNPDSQKSLFNAIKQSDAPQLRKLLQRNDINLNQPNSEGLPPLHMAIIKNDLNILASLLYDERIDINKTCSDLNWTPLHLAAYHGNLSLIQFLLKKGCRYGELDIDGRMPMDVAWRAGHSECSRLLRDQFNRTKK